MKKENKISYIASGDDRTLDPHAPFIQFEGSNTDFFYRIHGNVLNPDCKIIVPPTHQAIFIKDGKMQDVLEGGSYPLFETVKKGFLGFGKKVDAVAVDVIFMSRTVMLNAKWGTKVAVIARDPITEMPVHVTGHGEFEVSVDNPLQFYLQIVGSDRSWTLESLRERLGVRMMSFFDDALAHVMHDNIISYMDIQLHKKPIADGLVDYLNDLFKKDCGLSIRSFTVEDLGIQDDEMDAIEYELSARRREIKEKKAAKEFVEEIERLEDRANARKDLEAEMLWKKQLTLKELEAADKEKYYEVLKVLAEHAGNNAQAGTVMNPVPPKAAGNFCPSCGSPNEVDAKFCHNCGTRMPGHKLHCPKCGKELDSGSKFCPECGAKI